MITFQDFLSMQENFLRIINNSTDLDIRNDIVDISSTDISTDHDKTRKVARYIGVKIGQARNITVKTASVAASIITHPVTQIAAITATCSFFATILIAALFVSESALQLLSVFTLLAMFLYVCYLAVASKI